MHYSIWRDVIVIAIFNPSLSSLTALISRINKDYHQLISLCLRWQINLYSRVEATGHNIVWFWLEAEENHYEILENKIRPIRRHLTYDEMEVVLAKDKPM